MADRDLDQLFRRHASRTRPSPRFEEELLLRLEEELGAPDSARMDVMAAADADVIEIVEAPTRRRRSPISTLASLAAATIVVVGGVALVLARRDVPGTDIPAPVATAPPDDEIVDPILLAGIDDVCREHLSELERLFPSADPLPGGPTDNVVEVAAPVLRSMIDELRAVIASAPPPTLADAAAELDDLDQLLTDQELLLGAGQTDQLRTSLPLIARRVRLVAADLAAAGSAECQSAPPDDGS